MEFYLSKKKNEICRKRIVRNNLYSSNNKNLTLSQLRADERRSHTEDARRLQALSLVFC